MVNLVDLSLLDERSFFRLVRSNLLTEDIAFALSQTKKLDYGAIERKDEFLQLLTSEWQQHVMKQYVNMPSLHEDVFPPIFLFCEHGEIDKLALVCKEMNGHVETFADNSIKKFKDAHPVDSTWRSRLEQHTAHVHHGRVSHRHELLYVTQVYMHSQEIDNCYQVLKVPGKSKMLVRRQDESIISWDPKTKEVVRVLEAPTLPVGARPARLMLRRSQNFIVGIDGHNMYIMVWTIEGDFVHRIPLHAEGFLLDATRMLDDRFYYLQTEIDPLTRRLVVTRSLAEIDISSGVTRHGTISIFIDEDVMSFNQLLPIGSWVLLVLDEDGIYVLNRTDLSTTESHYPGDFLQLESHGNTVVAECSSGAFEILDLKNGGSLERLRSIQCSIQRSNHSRFMFDGSRIYLMQEHPRRIRQDVVLIHGIDISSDTSSPFPVWVSSMFCSCNSHEVVTDGGEIFCTFSIGDDNYRERGLVLVFPAKA